MTTERKFEEKKCTEVRTVTELQTLKFSKLNFKKEIFIRTLERPLPDIIFNDDIFKDITYVRNLYKVKNWLCGCEIRNALFCFPCLLFGGEQEWTNNGVANIKKIKERIKKHEDSNNHIKNCISSTLLKQTGCKRIKSSQIFIEDHNEKVSYNREILNDTIECILYCRNFMISLSGLNEINYFSIQDQFNELINIAITSNLHVKKNLNDNRTFQTLRDDIPDYLFQIYQNEIIKDVENTSFVAVIIDDITDVSEHYQLVIVLRYLLNTKILERFWGFFTPENQTANSLSKCIIEQLNIIFRNNKKKLIAQTFDGAMFMNGKKMIIQTNIKKFYKNAHFINCYDHQPNLIMKNIASTTINSKICFSYINAISRFFLKSPQYLQILYKHINVITSIPPNKRWNFNINTVKQVYEYLESLRNCFNEILSTSNKDQTISEAAGILYCLNNRKFMFWLELFNQIIPHVEKIYNEMKSPTMNIFKVPEYIKTFKTAILAIKNSEYCENFVKEVIVDAKQICDCTSIDIQNRYYFIKHLAAATLFNKDNINNFKNKFPAKEIKLITEAYPMINKEKFKIELQIFYDRDSMHNYNQLIDLFKFLIDNKLNNVLSEMTTMIEILLTTPMDTMEIKRCLPTLKKIKEFLKNTMYHENLNAITMMLIDNRFLKIKTKIKNDVITHLVHNEKRSDFTYK
ncbi:hypothetical protein M0804_005615 [Polistes exclamans]|nr:hypothetical protein M0804_005615 [Polistes exclamans]